MIKSLSDCIVIVDDLPYITEIIQHTLEGAGFTNVAVFNDPFYLLEAVKGGLFPRAAVTDFNMPGLNGSELLMQLSELFSDIDGIIITAQPVEARVCSQKYHIIEKRDYFAETITSCLFRLMENNNTRQCAYFP